MRKKIKKEQTDENEWGKGPFNLAKMEEVRFN